MANSTQRPDWWDWELDLELPHLRKRMLDRGFGEADVRAMLQSPLAVTPDHDPGRWLVRARYEGFLWEIVVEPEYDQRVLLVVTAYRVSI